MMPAPCKMNGILHCEIKHIQLPTPTMKAPSFRLCNDPEFSGFSIPILNNFI